MTTRQLAPPPADKAETQVTTRYFDPRAVETVREMFGTREGRFNPRTLSNPGFSPEKMENLRKGIAKDGLNHALLVRIVDDRPKLVAGERRLRAVLGLMETDEEALKRIKSGEGGVHRVLVKNPLTKRMEPALEVYGKVGVECKIADAKDEKEALRQAIQENTLHEGLTDYELLLQCDKMEKAGISRAEQAETMGDISEAWISQSHSLLRSNDAILRYMEKGQLTRTAALTFLNVEPEKVEATLKRAIDLTYKEAEQKETQAKVELDQAMDELQMGESALRLSQFTGNHESARKARRQVARASRAADKAGKKLSGAKAKGNKKITVDTINRAAKEVDADANLKKPQSMKNCRLITSEISDLLGSSDGDTLVNPANGEEYDRKHIELVHGALEWVLNQNGVDHPLDVILKVFGKPKRKPRREKVAAEAN